MQQQDIIFSTESSMINDVVELVFNVQAKKNNEQKENIQICIYTDDKWNPLYKTLVNWDVIETNLSYEELLNIKIDFRGMGLLLKIKLPSVFKELCKNNNIERANFRLIFMYEKNQQICMLYDDIEPIKQIDLNLIYN